MATESATPMNAAAEKMTGTSAHAFITKHQAHVQGVLSCFDRLIFKGYLPFCQPGAMEAFLWQKGVLLKDFKSFVIAKSEAVKEHALALAQKAGRPYIYLNRATRKEEEVAAIVSRDKVTQGLICVLGTVEQCPSFKLRYGKDRPHLVQAYPRCLCLYFYFVDRRYGLMHVRLQTWFPFVIQVYLNGHEWLARQMDQHGVAYERLDNAFIGLGDAPRAQRFADQLAHQNWPRVLAALARRVNPRLRDILAGLSYYWVIDQAEYSTDILFEDRAALKGLYAQLLRHATVCFSAEDVMTFLGRKLNGNFQGEVLTDFKRRWPGARVKHRLKGNWIKMYDKHGCVLRIETVINQPYEFRIRRQGIRQGQKVTGWFPMSKGVANAYRYAEVARAANFRYLEALSVVDDPSSAYRLLDRLCEPITRHQRRFRALNPLRRSEANLFASVLRGEHFIHGFRNRDIAAGIGLSTPPDLATRKRQSACISRKLQLLRAHGLIAKIPRARRYRLTLWGATLMTAVILLRQQDLPPRLETPQPPQAQDIHTKT
jgi:hypothetical protein